MGLHERPSSEFSTTSVYVSPKSSLRSPLLALVALLFLLVLLVVDWTPFQLILIAVLVLTSIFAIGFWVTSNITKPLNQVIKSISEFSGTHSFPILPPQTKGEIGRLVQAIREMAIRVVAAIQESKRSADELMAHTEELQRSNDALESFASVASHDLKSPLQGIQKIVSMIEDDSQNTLSPETRELFELLTRRANRMENLLGSLLEYSKAGTFFHEPELVDTNSIVRECLELLDPPKNITVVLDQQLPTISVCKVLFQRIMINLISNGIKHNGRDSATISITAEKKNDFIEFRIKDDGIGIEEKFQNKIFEMFTTLQPRDKVESTGMGLAITKRALEGVGGSVSLESESGKGSTFIVKIPSSS